MNELELRLHRSQHKLHSISYELGTLIDPKQDHDAGLAWDCAMRLAIEKLQELSELLGTDYLTPWE